MNTPVRPIAVMIAAVVLISLAFGQTTTEKTNGAPPSPSAQSGMGTPDEPTGTTLCELQNNPMRFAGKYIKVRATFAGNFEMSMLVDDSCPHTNVLIWYGQGMVASDSSQYALIDSIDALQKPNDIRWQPSARVIFHATQDSKRMADYIRKHKKGVGDITVTATFTGRFDYIPKWLALKAPDGKVTALSAFGHQICCSARLEPQSVTELLLPKK